MKKLTLSIGLVAAILSAKAQDTTCTYFKGSRVIEFDYKTSEIIYEEQQYNKFYEIEVSYGSVLCLDLSDDKPRTRKVITTFFDGSVVKQVLKSNQKVYFSPNGATKVSVGRPRFRLQWLVG